jgi:hypothetical protein
MSNVDSFDGLFSDDEHWYAILKMNMWFSHRLFILNSSSPVVDSPYILEEIPDSLVSDDPIAQDEFRGSLGGNSLKNDFRKKFETMRKSQIKLSTLRHLYEGQKSSAAIGLLSRRNVVTIDEDYIYDPNDPNLAFKAEHHYIDFFMAVSANIGLDAVLPRARSEASVPNFSFRLTLDGNYREWKTLHGQLGFDPSGRMLHIGRRYEEDVWIAFAPKTFVCRMSTEEHPGFQLETSTRLSTEHYRRFALFINYCLSQMSFEYFTLRRQYPDINDIEDLRQMTNIKYVIKYLRSII